MEKYEDITFKFSSCACPDAASTKALALKIRACLQQSGVAVDDEMIREYDVIDTESYWVDFQVKSGKYSAFILFNENTAEWNVSLFRRNRFRPSLRNYFFKNYLGDDAIEIIKNMLCRMDMYNLHET